MRFYKKLETKHLFYSLIAFLFVPFVCFLILHLQGLTFSEFINQLVFIKKYSLSESIQLLFTYLTGLYPSIHTLKLDFRYFIKIFPLFVLFLGFIGFGLKYFCTKPKNYYIYIILLVFTGWSCYNIFLGRWMLAFIELCWLPLFTVFIFAVMLVLLFKNKNYLKDGSYTILVLLNIINRLLCRNRNIFICIKNSSFAFNDAKILIRMYKSFGVSV